MLSARVWDEGIETVEVYPAGISEKDFTELENVVVRRMNADSNVVTHAVISRKFDTLETLDIHYVAATDSYRGRFIVTGTSAEDAQQELAKRRKEYEARCFTPRELYALKPIKTSTDPYHLINVHLSEGVPYAASNADANLAEHGLIEIRTLADECSDGRRTWTLETIWFKGRPVMVVNSSGRDGDEYHNRFITDRESFEDMVSYIRSFCNETQPEDRVSADTVIPGMTEFYNATIHRYYDVDKQEKKL